MFAFTDRNRSESQCKCLHVTDKSGASGDTLSEQETGVLSKASLPSGSRIVTQGVSKGLDWCTFEHAYGSGFVQTNTLTSRTHCVTKSDDEIAGGQPGQIMTASQLKEVSFVPSTACVCMDNRENARVYIVSTLEFSFKGYTSRADVQKSQACAKFDFEISISHATNLVQVCLEHLGPLFASFCTRQLLP